MSIKRILAMFLAVVLAGSLSACDAHSPIAGTWVGTLDYSQILQEEFSGVETWEDIPLEGICLQIQFDFQNDGSFTTKIDEESTRQMVSSLMDFAVEGLSRNMQEQGTLNMTKEQLRSVLETQIDLSAVTEPLEFVFGSGYYVYQDGRVYIGSQPRSLQADPENNAAEVMDVTLQEGSMTVNQLSSHENSAQDFLPGLLPFTLVKQ